MDRADPASPVGSAVTEQGMPAALSALGLIICGAMAAMALWPMLLVTAPMVYFDTAAYGATGQKALTLLLGADGATGAGAARDGGPPTGLRSAAWSVSIATLGPVILCWAQTWMVLVMVAALVPPGARPVPLLLGAGLLLLASGLPWYASYAMPDLLGAAVLVYYALLVGPYARIGPVWRGLLGLGACFAILGHYGHIPLAGALALGAVAIALWRRCAIGAVLLAAAGPLVLALVVNLGASVAMDRLSAPPPDASVPQSDPSDDVVGRVAPGRLPILLARSIEDGPARLHLTEACTRDAYRSCAFLPDPLPETVGAFLWSAETGIRGLTAAERSVLRADEMQIVLDAARAYPGQQTAALLGNVGAQLIHVGISEHLPRPASGARASMDDQASHAALGWADIFVPISVWTGAIALFGLALIGRVPNELKAPLLLILGGLLVNAAIYGGLSYPVDRYQGRIAWLLPALALGAVVVPRHRRMLEDPR